MLKLMGLLRLLVGKNMDGCNVYELSTPYGKFSPVSSQEAHLIGLRESGIR